MTIHGDVSNLIVPILRAMDDAPTPKQTELLGMAMGALNKFYIEVYVRSGPEFFQGYEIGKKSAQIVMQYHGIPPLNPGP